MTVIPTQLDVQSTFVRGALADLHTCMPAEVVAVREGKDARCFVDVLPQLQRAVVNEEGELVDEPYPVIPMVPVGYMQGGGFFVSVPIAVGDIVTLVFAERSLDSWIETAARGQRAAVVPGDLSMHSLEGAIAIPCGPAPRAALLAGVDASDFVIGRTDGTVLLRLTAAGQAWFAEGADFVALASKVMAGLNKIQSTFDAHTHSASTTATVGAGPAVGTVTVLAPSSKINALEDVAATKTKAT